MEYELIREIFNECSGNQMRDVFVDEIITADTDDYLKRFLVGADIETDKHVNADGSVIYDVIVDGLRQRYSFTPI